MKRKFRRVREEAWFSGVCAGIAYKIACPTWIVRMFWILIPFVYGAPSVYGAPISIGKIVLTLLGALLFYGILRIFIPAWEKRPDDFEKITEG